VSWSPVGVVLVASTHALVAKVQKQTRHHQSHSEVTKDAQGASLETLSECSLFSLAKDRPRPRIYLPPHARHVSCGLHAGPAGFLKYPQR
jgi:hypothetical protein